MGTQTALSIEEYLHTVFDGSDREYLDGEIVERNIGNKSHGRVQGTFVYRLTQFETATGIFLLVYRADGLHEVEQLELPEFGIVLSKSAIFS